MVVVPPAAVLPTTPVVLLTVATEGLVLVQVPPEGEQVRVVVVDGQIEVGPLMVPGVGVTVTVVVVAL